MHMAQRGRPPKAKKLILEAATELFFRNGYQATGIQEIIERAGVTKPSFYSHFESKEALCLEYLRTRQIGDMQRFYAALDRSVDAVERFFIPLVVLEEVQLATEFRGCPYFNMLSEMGQYMAGIRTEILNVSANFESLFQKLAEELIASNTTRFKHLSVSDLTSLYALLFNGAIALSQEQLDPAPIAQARAHLGAVIGFKYEQ